VNRHALVRRPRERLRLVRIAASTPIDPRPIPDGLDELPAERVDLATGALLDRRRRDRR
jgi:hypothetical protein